MADKKDDSSSGGLRLFGALIFAAAVVAFPGFMCVAIAGGLASELRKVRASRFALWAVVTGIIALIIAGSPAVLLAGGASMLAFLAPAGTFTGTGGVSGWLAAHEAVSLSSLLWPQIVFGIPAGLAAAALFTLIRYRARRLDGESEGKLSMVRPVGWQDQLRRRRNIAAIARGDYLVLPESNEQTSDNKDGAA